MNTKEKIAEKKSNKSLDSEHKFLILYNDEINEYNYVVDSLIQICKHDSVQAEQCTYLAHIKGKCDVKKDIYSKLKPMREALSDRGLITKIE
ncbi:MAG: ATP-dependent Clp protease adaptor ClpS [Bacteroidetes bacterium]|jgi:ATP-dependent Clp protease adaptor protein ClpS|nr:ATP-dependent Clp protease adaptor ClpS [Bacteroidota bacterium]MBT6685073.1 ATP-dependent Clp protease adaptor ClpS [Bacteroidota bacterium]MBT7144562.1 ATP-dependent Clp protease adaptor ClpS [Bacteroidota bacterium]MBT7491773.1 ATP-dependent Clp protease adaptor ClpS [Bacteroidota bacterium]